MAGGVREGRRHLGRAVSLSPSDRLPPSGNGGATVEQVVEAPGDPPPAVAAIVEPPKPESVAPRQAPDGELIGAVAAAMSLVKAYRMHGHLNARLDPLGSEPMGDPALDETRLEPPLTPELQSRIPARLLRLYVPGSTLLEALPRLKEVYTGTIAYEIEHISDHAERVWLRQAIESGRFRTTLTDDERRGLLERLARVEAFETYLRRAFIGQKQFSIEGLDVLVPMLDEAVELAARSGAHEVLIGIAHRGRLNVLTHVVGQVVHVDPPRVRGRALHRRSDLRPRGRDRRRQVPPRGIRVARHCGGGDRGHGRVEPEPPRGGRPGRRGPRPRRADGSLVRRRDPRPHRRAARPHPRRCLVRRSGRGRGDVQPALARRLLDRRHAPPHRQQPGRVHDGSRRGQVDAILERPREGIRRPDRPRQRRRSRGRDLGDQARAGVPRGVRARRRRRPRRLPALRPQRAGRGRLHAAAAGRAHRSPAPRAGDVRRATRRGRSRGGRRCRAHARGDARGAQERSRRPAVEFRLERSRCRSRTRGRTREQRC